MRLAPLHYRSRSMPRTLRSGSRGLSVETLQRKLNDRGFGPVDVDGAYGPATAAALRQFQLSAGLDDDGICGPITWSAILHEEPLPVVDVTISRQEALLSRLIATPKTRAVLTEAIRWIDKTEQPPGSNVVPGLTEGYREYWRIGGSGGLPWCAIAVSQWIRVGLELDDWSSTPMLRWLGGVSQWETWAGGVGCILPGTAPALPGDVFTMGRAGSLSDASNHHRAGHCGLVLWADDTHIQTIEGNTSNRVQAKRRARSTLRHLIRWSDVA